MKYLSHWKGIETTSKIPSRFRLKLMLENHDAQWAGNLVPAIPFQAYYSGMIMPSITLIFKLHGQNRLMTHSAN